MATTNYRRILNEPKMLIRIDMEFPGWAGFERSKKGTDTYNDIAEWHQGYSYGVRYKIDNSVVYDTADDCFIGLDLDYAEPFFLDVDLSTVLPDGLWQVFAMDDEVMIVREDMFPESLLEVLEDIECISKRIVVPAALTRGGK